MERGAEYAALAAQLRKKRVMDSNLLTLHFAWLFKLTLVHTRLSKMVRIQTMLSDKLRLFDGSQGTGPLQRLIGAGDEKGGLLLLPASRSHG